MNPLRGGDLTRIGLRASLLQATWNYERQQGLGWAWALKPALDRIYPEGSTRRARLAEHTAYFNTQPTLASLALGAVASLEEGRAAGNGLDADAVGRVKSVLGASLAALGDRLFWYALRPFAATLGVLLALTLTPWAGALAMWLAYNAVHLPLRIAGTHLGYRAGPGVLTSLRPRLEAVIRMLGVAGSGLVGVVIAVLLVPDGVPRPLGHQMLLALGLGFGLIAAQRSRPSPTGWGLALGAVTMASVWWR